MPTPLSQKFFNILRLQVEQGLPAASMDYTKSQRERVVQCEEVFRLYVAQPWMDLRQYFANRWGHTHNEIINDIAIINFLADKMNKGTRAIDELKVRAVANKAIADGAKSGDSNLSIKGAALLTKVARLDQPESSDDNSQLMAGMPIVITGDPSIKYKNKRHLTPAEHEAIRKKWGVTKDEWQELVEVTPGYYAPEGDAPHS